MIVKKLLTRLLIALFIVNLFSFSVSAEVSEEDKAKIKEKQAELQQLEGKMNDQKQKVEEKRKKALTAYEQLLEVENALKIAEKELSEIEGNLKKVETQIQENTEALRKTKLSLEVRINRYNSRIRNIYMHGQINYLDVLLGAKDFSDFTTRFELLLRIMRNDIKLIQEIKQEQEKLKLQQEKLQASQQELKVLHAEADAKRQIIANRREQRKQIFNQAAAERDTEERSYNELLSTSRQITDMIKRLETGGKLTGKGTGSMIWPLRGQITSPYGWRIHPIYGSRRFHSGIDIGADYGDSILAADEGVVITAGWLGGYGYAVIIDHGSGLTTLYAHNNELRVNVGQRVYKGQVISLAGSTGNSTGPHLHFEVRRHGETVQPLDYLP